MKQPGFLAGISVAVLMSFNIYAQSPAMMEFKQFFKKGQYAKAVSALEKINDSESANGERFYLLGECFFKLQEFDKAIANYELAIKTGNKEEGLYYQYGQALYASNELKKSRSAFMESVTRKFNPSVSKYYIAHISQILEEYQTARDNYTSLLKEKETDNKIQQIARFQLAETLLVMLKEKGPDKEKQEKQVEKHILPLMKQALKTDKSTAVANDITQRIAEIEKEYNLDPNMLINGKRISEKRYTGYVFQKVKFDDNITLTNEENNVTQSKKESFIFESEAYVKYDFVFKKRLIVSPEVRLNFIENSDQDSADVFQNDTYSINANLKNKFEHVLVTAPASLIFDLEYSSNYKDWQQKHTREHYAESFTLSIGELFSFFSFGDSSFKIKFKDYKGENSLISNRTKIFSADQTFMLPIQHLLIAFFQVDFIDNYNNTATNTDTFLTRFDYIIPEIMPSYTLDIALAATITDTKAQEASRGTEFTLNPSIDLSKQINERFKIGVNYDFTKNNSKQADYKYTKSVFSTEFRYSF